MVRQMYFHRIAIVLMGFGLYLGHDGVRALIRMKANAFGTDGFWDTFVLGMGGLLVGVGFVTTGIYLMLAPCG